MNNRLFQFFVLQSVFIIIGLAVQTQVFSQTGQKDNIRLMLDIEENISRLAQNAGKAVVSISTEKTARTYGSNLRPFGDDFYDRFFRDFFGQIPQQEYKQIGLGSGVIIDNQGYILTNEHVISGADKISVTLPDGREFKAKIQGADHRSDLAVIKIEATDLPYAQLGNSDNLKVGQWAIAIGNPFGFAVSSPEPTITFGVISALHRALPRMSMYERVYLDLIQTDAAINPGNSGGPLVNIQGEVIGINVAIFSTSGGSEGIGFALPINDAKSILGRLIKGEKIAYGWLGIAIQDLNPDLADYFGLKNTAGVLVLKILPQSPAAAADFQEKDIIVEFDNKKIGNTQELLKYINWSKVGTKVPVKVIRNKKSINLAVVIGERQAESKQPIPSQPILPPSADIEKWRGITVSNITDKHIQQFSLQNKSGVVVVDIEENSSAAEAGITIGDIITEINYEQINDIADYKNAVSKTGQSKVLVVTNRGYFILKP